MAQQPQSASQYAFGPASNGGGDIFHFIPANANPSAGSAFQGWYDKNGLFDGVAGETNALSNGAPAQIVGATGGVFSVTALSLPGGSAYEQVPFVVKAAGYVSFAAGTYTATIQPLIYGSTTAGFTAAAASALTSATAVNMTMAGAVAVVVPWETEVSLSGDSTSGKLTGSYTQRINNGAQQLVAPVVAVNLPTSVSFSGVTPLQFLAGVTLSNAGAASAVNLGSFFLES